MLKRIRSFFSKDGSSGGERDYEQFPDDDNGAVLWHMRSEGDSLTTPREIDFGASFPSERAAFKFAAIFLRNYYRVEMFEPDPGENDKPEWSVEVHIDDVPTHSRISEVEAAVIAEAKELGGRSNGWSATFVPTE
jgi:hypothetical protein